MGQPPTDPDPETRSAGTWSAGVEPSGPVSLSILRAIMEGTTDAVFVKDCDGKYLMINAAGARFMGATPEAVVGRHDTDFFTADTVDEVFRSDRQVLQSGQTTTREERITAAGVTRTYLATKGPLHDEQGRIVGIFGISRDISDRIAAVEALRASEARFQAIFREAAIGVVVADLEGRALEVNPALERMLGCTAAEMRDRKFSEFTHPDDQERSLELSRELLEGRREQYQIEKRLIREDGQVLWVRAIGSAVRGPDGRPSLCIGMLEDISEQRRVQDQLTQSQKMEAIGRLAGGIAHDFNNMLAVINGYCDLLLAGSELPHTAQCSLHDVRKAGQRAAHLTGQLLAFSRKSVVRYETLDLNETIRGMEQMLRRLLGEDIELQTDLDPNAGAVRADRGQLDQIVLNLAVNARDAMLNGGRLLIRTRRTTLAPGVRGAEAEAAPGEYVQLMVQDTGNGLSPDDLSHIWEPFYSTKGNQGTGLGLSIVYGIVQQSEGIVTVESEAGRGAAFFVYLPRICAPAAGAPTPEPGPALRGTETVLLVEDEPMLRHLVRDVLQGTGYRVLDAENGPEALRVAEQHPGAIDLLLTDVVMPGGLSGRQLAERLTAQRPEMKVLFMSGYTDDAVLRHGVQYGGTAFLAKPFTPASLTRKLRELL